jgi:signal transduction histidine kinase/ligand-binding sensor domain-containing protein/CheY-like chemotaxis protein/HPt (histidine-containing phosphotransfer) domain-containing protein
MRVRANKLTGAWRASLITLLGCLCGASGAYAADAPPLVLAHITPADGLPQGTVMATLQDSQGFVWFGTEDGLVRFDGEQLQRYAHSRTEEQSLPGNFVWDIAEDARRDLWIATKDSGLARWNRATDTFTAYRHDDSNPASLASDSLRTVLVDARGRVWVGTSDAGVSILDPATGRFEHLRHDATKPASLSSDLVRALAHGKGDSVWIGTEAGLDRWHPDVSTLEHFGPAAREAHSLVGQHLASVLEDRSGAVWAGTFDGGLTRLAADGRVLETFRHDAARAGSLASDEVRAILEDAAGRLWIGTANGLDLLDRASGEIGHYQYDPNDSDSLRASYIMSLHQDAAGLVWIGTRGGGVSRWNPRSWELGSRRPAWLATEPVQAFADAPNNQVWVGSTVGLARFDPETGSTTPLDEVLGKRNALGNSRVMSLRRDRQSSLWIGTMADGLKRLTPDGRIESIPVRPGDARATSAPGIMTIVESRDGRLWIGTFGGGANVLDPATGTIRQLPHDEGNGSLAGANVTAIAEDPSGNLWVGTDGAGLNLVRPDGSLIRTFRHDPNDTKSLPVNIVYSIAVDPNGRVWIGTDGGGLARVDGSASDSGRIRFEAFTRAQGLTSDTVYGIVPDAAGKIWLSGNSGLMRFDPETQAIKTYHREQGVQGEEFSFGAALRLRDGRICFGGAGGFNVFDPQRLTENKLAPRLALTGIEVLGVRMPGPTPFWLRDHVALDYRGSIVSFDFGVLDFSSPKHNRLAYRMPGLTDSWLDLGSQRRITLTNLDAGDHVLEVRAASADSEWSTTPVRVTIHRDPAPWRSPTAYAVYAALLLAIILYRVHRQRARFLEVQRARDRLESEVQLRTRELVESNRQLAEAARAKSDFLDRMSHELRTPMNGVVGMTELLSRTALSATQTHLTKTIRSSAQILLQIVNDLLDLSKIRAGKVALERLPIDLGQVLEECTSLFAGAAENKCIELIVCPPARVEKTLLGDPLRVRQILMNLVGNAVKFTSVGEVVVRADIESAEGDDALVRIRVSDTGIGMDAAAISKIFEPFSQADETTTRKFGGTGLGLAICRELADLMGARITVDSKPQIGSTFCLSLPMKTGDAVLASSLQLPAKRVQVLTRRQSLEESLTRHATALGMAVTAESADIVVVDASTYREELRSLLAAGSRSSLIVLAKNSEVEALGLRVLLHEKAVVLKPVHRIALQEAFAVASGLEVDSGGSAPLSEVNTPQLGGHVLLVEDEAVNAAVAEGYLSALGCTLAWVKDGNDAVARAGAERFDLIFMDLNMPGIDGFTAAKLIREREAGAGKAGARVPIIALTAHDAVNFRSRVLDAQMDDILSKPYSLEECTKVLRKWLPATMPAPSRTARAEVRSPAQPSEPVRTSGALATVDSAAVAALKKLRGGAQADLYSRLVELFRSSSADSLTQLGIALNAGDLRAAASACHKLAASAGNVGALAYARELRELEHLCAGGEASGAGEIFQALQAAHAPLIDALIGHTMRASA